LQDRVFHAPGTWNIVVCPNRACSLYWLNPMPEPSDLSIAYESYYTHDEGSSEERARTGRREGSWLGAAHRIVMDATGTTRARRLANESYLGGVKPGRLLEVGCGGGSRLIRLQTQGWIVEGQDVDPRAGAHALAARGITVHAGALDALHLPAERYDAIVMNHVIEHAADPLALLRECRCLLAPGGQLVVVTPNTASLGHRFWGAGWRPLEPPRHLFLFSVRNLPLLVRKAGYTRVDAWTSAAHAGSVGVASWDIRTRGRHKTDAMPARVSKLVGAGFQIAASLAVKIWRNSGEEVVLRAWK
jgi:SAM-dependent methyltransferase